ncbi:MAG: GTP-binding protein [Acidimicrobiales bacterium]
MATQNYKICVVGKEKSGKTKLVNTLLGYETTERYIPTLGVDVHPLILHTNNGLIRVNLWDCAGQECFGGLRDGYYTGADAFLMFTEGATPERQQTIIQDIARVVGNKPVIECGMESNVSSVYSLLRLVTHDEFLGPAMIASL